MTEVPKSDLPATVAAWTAGDVMSSPVVTVGPEATPSEVAETLHRHRITGLPVLDDSGEVIGLVSEYDLLAKSGATAREVMSTAVISITPTTAVDDVRHLLVDRRIRRVPVLAEGRLVGIVSRGDVVALMATEWVCEVCGESVRGESAPETCPKCHSGSARFVLQEQPPGT